MDTFYDGDLKDIWDSDLDPADSLNISTQTDMHDWFLERDVKDPAVILNDKLISDALLNGTLPIKSEHSYSINSDGDSLPASPRSLHTKMDDMEDECYPAISLKTATSNLRSIDTITIDPKCLLISSGSSSCSTSSLSSSSAASSASSSHSSASSPSPLLSGSTASPLIVTTLAPTQSASPLLSQSTSHTTNNNHHHHNNHHNNHHNSLHSHQHSTASSGGSPQAASQFTGLKSGGSFSLRSLEHGSCLATSPATLTLSKRSAAGSLSAQPHAKQAHLSSSSSSSAAASASTHHHYLHSTTTASGHQQSSANSLQHHQLLPQFGGAGSLLDPCSPASSMREGSTSPDICSDIEIDESCIKDEPMSPDSSCPPSPTGRPATAATTTTGRSAGSLNLSVANMAAYTHSDLVFEHKNGCLQLTPASQSLLKSQQLLLTSTGATSSTIIPKFIKTELGPGTSITKTAIVTHNTGAGSVATANGKTYGVPLTPPSSLSSDDSEGNLSPEPLYSPLSPATAASLAGVEGLASSSSGSSSASSVSSVTASGGNGSSNANTPTSHGRRNVAGNCHGLGRGGGGAGSSGNAGHSGSGSAGSTRQPIHTPLISTQPKGSTGTLILTEEEKRTLLAEGYPIPQKLPLTKAEEKSLKKIRRKIKNKISAQESRRKKKEYMDQLERKVEILVSENNDYKKRVDSLEDTNATLLNQLHKLQALVSKQKKQH